MRYSDLDCEVCETFEGMEVKGRDYTAWLLRSGQALHVEIEPEPRWKGSSYVVRIPANFCPSCGRKWGKGCTK